MSRHKTFLSRQEITTRSKLCHDIIKVRHDRIQEIAQKTGRDIKLHAAIEASDKDLNRDRTFYVTTEQPNWAINLGIHNAVFKVRHNIGKSINRRI